MFLILSLQVPQCKGCDPVQLCYFTDNKNEEFFDSQRYRKKYICL